MGLNLPVMRYWCIVRLLSGLAFGCPLLFSLIRLDVEQLSLRNIDLGTPLSFSGLTSCTHDMVILGLYKVIFAQTSPYCAGRT